MIKVAIAGYGNLGRGAECAVKNSTDMELYGAIVGKAYYTGAISLKEAIEVAKK